jgi:succinoglycan biosynthesis transport protein ExoP
MNLRQFLRALRARCRVFFVALASVVLAATLASLVMPKSYRATVSVLVDTKDEQSLSEALRPLVLPQERLSYLQTQEDILTSPKVARQVVQALRLTQNPAALAALGVRLRNDRRDEDRLVEALLHHFKAETTQSSVIQASFMCADARVAATIANAFADAYVDTMLELRVAPTRKAATWFEEQLRGLRANLEEAQAKLDAQTKLDAQAKLAQSPDRLPEVMNNAFIQQLKADVLHGEAKLQELATQYGVNHPVYRRQVSENQSLRAKLEAEMRKVAAGAASSEEAASAIPGGHPRDAQWRSVGSPPRTQPLEQVLTRNVESAERTYDTAMQRYVVSQVDSRASQANVAVLNPAVPPLAAFRPNIVLNLALALVSGIALGGVLVILLETQDRRVRSAEDLLGVSRVPLLGVLSDERRRRARLLTGPPATVLRALPKPG